MASTLLRGGTLYDGTGGAPFQADLLMESGRIAALGKDLPVPPDARVLDCQGLIITPGIMDAHSHNEFFMGDGAAFFEPFALQGVTTQVGGNCGFSPFGYEKGTPHQSLVGGGLFHVNGKGDASSFEGFAQANPAAPLNLATLVGHGTLRIGLSGYENRPLTKEELSKLCAKADACMAQGAFGASLGLMYEPGRYAPFEELKALAQVVKDHGKVLTIHARACSAVSTSYGLPFGGPPHNLRALQEAIDLCQQTGVKLQFSHLIFVGRRSFGTVDRCMKMMDEVRGKGYSFLFDMYACTFGASVITVVLPTWYLPLSLEKKRSAAVRARLALEIGVTKKLLGFDFSDITIAYISPEHRAYEGKTVSQIAKEEGVSDLDAYLKLVDLSQGHGRVLMDRYYTQEIIERLAQHPGVLYMTDAWVEQSGVQNAAAYGTFPRFLQLARDKKIDPLPVAIRKMTGATADRFGLKERGYLKEGYAADVSCFDLDRLEGNVLRPEPPKGVVHVFVNGVPVVEGGKATGRLNENPGVLLKS